MAIRLHQPVDLLLHTHRRSRIDFGHDAVNRCIGSIAADQNCLLSIGSSAAAVDRVLDFQGSSCH